MKNEGEGKKNTTKQTQQQKSRSVGVGQLLPFAVLLAMGTAVLFSLPGQKNTLQEMELPFDQISL